jgi:hypothetical protein
LRWVLTTYSLLPISALPKTVGLIGVIKMLDEFCFLVLIDLLARVLKTEFWKLFFNSCSGDYGWYWTDCSLLIEVPAIVLRV